MNTTHKPGYFGEFGGQYVPETLMSALADLEQSYHSYQKNKQEQKLLQQLLKDYVGRPTPLYHAKQLSKQLHADIYLKREDLAHTGAHKINNALGQGLLARSMGKSRLIAETGAGQHGVATATIAASLGMRCTVYMGTRDIERQKPNVFRMKLLGAEVIPVRAGSQILKDAINEALRDWIANRDSTHYLLGSVLGPHPYPTIVRDFQTVIGKEARKQIIEQVGCLPDYLIACVGGGSNAIGLFHRFLKDREVQMIGVEAGGLGIASGQHAARFAGGKTGILHGTKSYVLQDSYGQIKETHSVSAGLDYPSIGPEHSFLHRIKRIKYIQATDQQALQAFSLLSRTEGIISALESAHAIAGAVKMHRQFKKSTRRPLVIINLSGRGDKDLDTAIKHLSL